MAEANSTLITIEAAITGANALVNKLMPPPAGMGTREDTGPLIALLVDLALKDTKYLHALKAATPHP